MKAFSQRQLQEAKRRFMEKCRGSRAVTPIEPSNVEAIVDQFVKELEQANERK